MSPKAVLLPLLTAVLAIGIGWIWPGRPPSPLSVTRYGRTGPPAALSRPDEGTVADLPDLIDQLSGPSPAPTSGDPDTHEQRPPPHLPPPPDERLIFRRQVTAVINEGSQGLAVMLRDPTNGTDQSRLLKIGDRFDGQWRLQGLTTDEAVLQNGAEVIRVPLYGGLGGG